jgi:uncharacterized protein (TIGR00645 family)
MGEPADLGTLSKPAIERGFELWLFRSRWIMAPFYAGLVLALTALLWVFLKEAWHGYTELVAMTPGEAILLALSLIDLSLTGNLVLIVIFSGYQNFVSRIETGGHKDWPTWIDAIDYSGLKMKLIASVVAISTIALLHGFLQIVQGEALGDRTLAWLIGLHVTFLLSAVTLAVVDWISGHTKA